MLRGGSNSFLQSIPASGCEELVPLSRTEVRKGHLPSDLRWGFPVECGVKTLFHEARYSRWLKGLESRVPSRNTGMHSRGVSVGEAGRLFTILARIENTRNAKTTNTNLSYLAFYLTTKQLLFCVLRFLYKIKSLRRRVGLSQTNCVPV